MSIVSDVTATCIRDAITRRKEVIFKSDQFLGRANDFQQGVIYGLEIAEQIADDNID
jgi:hypothetical protein